MFVIVDREMSRVAYARKARKPASAAPAPIWMAAAAFVATGPDGAGALGVEAPEVLRVAGPEPAGAVPVATTELLPPGTGYGAAEETAAADDATTVLTAAEVE
jgi:hypothetical protein